MTGTLCSGTCAQEPPARAALTGGASGGAGREAATEAGRGVASVGAGGGRSGGGRSGGGGGRGGDDTPRAGGRGSAPAREANNVLGAEGAVGSAGVAFCVDWWPALNGKRLVGRRGSAGAVGGDETRTGGLASLAGGGCDGGSSAGARPTSGAVVVDFSHDLRLGCIGWGGASGAGAVDLSHGLRFSSGRTGAGAERAGATAGGSAGWLGRVGLGSGASSNRNFSNGELAASGVGFGRAADDDDEAVRSTAGDLSGVRARARIASSSDLGSSARPAAGGGDRKRGGGGEPSGSVRVVQKERLGPRGGRVWLEPGKQGQSAPEGRDDRPAWAAEAGDSHEALRGGPAATVGPGTTRPAETYQKGKRSVLASGSQRQSN